jgi:outer membrane protein TolC
MRLYQKILFVLLIISFCSAEETIFLSLKDAIGIAIENSIELRIAKDQVESGKTRIYQAKSQSLPKLGLELKSEYEKKKDVESYWIDLLGERIEVSATPSPPWKNDFTLFLSQKLYSGGEITGRIRQTKIQKEYLEYEKELTKQDLIFLVSKAYWELKSSILQNEIASLKVKYLKIMVEKGKKRLELGSISKIELRQIETNLIQAEDILAQSKAEEGYFKGRLLGLLNIRDCKIPIFRTLQ